MSIYGTILNFDSGDHEENCSMWVEDAEIRDCYSLDPDQPCSCGQPFAPYKYEGSHILPQPDSPKKGYLSLASIPSFISRDGQDNGKEGELKDFLRLSVLPETIVLDRAQVEKLTDSLIHWLERKEDE